MEVHSEMIKKLLRLLSLMFCFTKSDELANFTVSPALTDSVQALKSNALFFYCSATDISSGLVSEMSACCIGNSSWYK